MTLWPTTVTQLVLVFRDALRALVPHMEKAKIEWQDESAYDDWDEIAQTLYEKIVVASLRWAIPEDERERCQLPAYNTMYPSYAGKTVIVVNRGVGPERLVFHSFTTIEEPFDKVRACTVGADGRVVGGEFVLLDVDRVTYRAETPDMTLVDITVDV
jgi:hypothetical protein